MILLTNALIIALFCLFLNATTWNGQIFNFVRKYIPPEKSISKPIYNCPICMAPWWGTIIFLVFFPSNISTWFLTIMCAGGFGVISVMIIMIKEAAFEASNYFENKNKENELN